MFDVDGVVADVRHRLRHLEKRPKDWTAFFAAAHRDPALRPGVDLVHEYTTGHELVWLTGRPERLRTVTERWFSEHGLPVGRLLMRPDHDRRPAKDYKAHRVRRLAADATIAVIVDDDPEVVRRLQRDGFPVRLADWVPHRKSLARAQERDGRT
ncbi:hypothetical protein Acy02nite_80130 [Actinoplanes cyaneus]|uniref:Polynucleotide kinase PNKP phosphatase domain-containing protein n=1 Tax=Actinoplanes cyaneus TaxID=52696 RepID=A0A919M8S6_9ACTN|nr:hypothetical protein [Actinoplanes cyaneus]MCW2140786.1 hypothetical protein [Actinoplanes cyaneus]GID70132.1 hypothetical protein Acy02nite_80130 [Actinoplanes cyaneus]